MSSFNLIIFILIFVSIVADILLNVFWVEAYYLKGILLYSKRYFVPSPSSHPVSAYELNIEYSNPAYHRYLFKELCESIYAFREKYLQINAIAPPRFMHGLIIWNKDDGYVEVRGYANLVPVVIMAIVIVNALYNIFNGLFLISVVSIVGFLIIFALLYVLQLAMFNSIGKYCAENWSRGQLNIADA
jgi:hypothetical protein